MEERRTGRRDVWTINCACLCGWTGPARRHLVSAEDDSAAHLLETQS
jgi:hypothetical protein